MRKSQRAKSSREKKISSKPSSGASHKPALLQKAAPPSLLDLFLAFFVPFFVYLLTLYPTVGTEDSGELITAAATLDIAHPSGYPLHTLLGHLFTWLIPFGNIAWRVNIMSAFFGAMTVAVVYMILEKLSRSSHLPLIFSLFFAFSGIFWSQSVRTEVYTLDIFLLASIIYSLLRWDGTGRSRHLWLAVLCFGLGVSNHHMILLAAPPAFIFVLMRNRKIFIDPKIMGISALMLALGLSFYLYLPIRTALGPYDNPAYIKHEGLYTPESFFKFVNRGIYGGTIKVASQEEESTGIAGVIAQYADRYAKNNLSGFPLMLKHVSSDLLYLPFALFLPGLWFLARKNGRFTVFLLLLFFFYTSVQLTFVASGGNLHPLTIHSNRPFYLSAILLTAIVSGVGLNFLVSSLKNKKISGLLAAALMFLPMTTLAYNFHDNNESRNYIARDFSWNLLQSLPRNAFLLSTGKDNLTFPLYYLRKVEKVRPDVDLEIYYGKKCPDRITMEEKLSLKKQPFVFIDLLPCGYDDLDLAPYNFVYAYGDASSLSHLTQKHFTLRGIRKKMDYPNSKLKGLYYMKMAILNENDAEIAEYYFNKVKTEIYNVPQLLEFMSDYRAGRDATGMF